MKAERIVGGYLVAQGVAVAAWWGLLLGVPGAVDWFQPAGWPRGSLLGFWLADGLLLVLGSWATAAVVWRSPAWASNAVWALAAACGYPTLYCIGVSLTTGQAWVASAMMTTMAGLTLAMATIYGSAGQRAATYRAVEMKLGRAVVWSLLQVVVFWCTFFGVLPLAVAEVEAWLGVARFDHPWRRVLAAGLFVVMGGLGVWSMASMARYGRGTPLPTATGSVLVIEGPYRWVRNPMALAGIVQGVAVGWFMGSWSVIAYALAGALLWHCGARPSEEADLVRRFGEPYERYRRAVRLWVPRVRPLQRSEL